MELIMSGVEARRPSSSPAQPSPGAAAQLRHRIRDGGGCGPTSGQAVGYVQANLVILPANLAGDFLQFCQRNPKPCPLLAVSEPGDPRMPALGADLDLRTDVPRYRIWRDGVLVAEPSDIVDLWRDDLVGFALGCSFSFEEALVDAGLELRHWTQNCNVPMYKTDRPTAAAGVFRGPLVVSMRPFRAIDAIKAIQVTSRYAAVHGAPVHLGDPRQIGISNLSRPDFGDPVEVHADELPVFWACGVTPQAVVMEAKPAFCITHAPGHMLVTDLRNAALSLS
ncbi:MAG TPA: putative hydro-lyase [Kofleriaceae bacterium]